MTVNLDTKHPLSVALVVAHPDDEILWAGGLVLSHPWYRWEIVSLTRGSDPDRAPRFFQVLEQVGATGQIADLNDGPEQHPLDTELVQQTILQLLKRKNYDLLLTHGPHGEYTRHRRHEDVSAAVSSLWITRRVVAEEMWQFAYEDRGKTQLPQAISGADLLIELDPAIWKTKLSLITNVYAFSSDSWEARTTPRREAFWCFRSIGEIGAWLDNEKDRMGNLHEVT